MTAVNKKLLIIFCLFLTVSCVSVYNPVTQRNEWYVLDEQGEISWGKAMAKQFLKENKLIKDKAKLERVRDLGKKIAAFSHRSNLEYQFYVIDHSQMNALAIPGGHIFIYEGLLDKITEPELAFVLAHEIAHTSARHSLKKLGASLGFSLLATTLLRSPDQAQAKQMVDQLYGLVALGYSRSDELQADSLAFDYSLAAGYNPEAAISLFEKLATANKKAAKRPFYLSSHPQSAARIKNIKTKLEELKTGGGE